MSWLDAARHRLRVLLRPERYGRELDEEMEFHLSLDAMQRAHEQRPRTGPDADPRRAARRAARRRFGSPTYYKEESRQMAGLGFLDMARQDVRFALRSFRRT